MKKILYVENLILGHHKPYLKALAESDTHESVIITPEPIEGIDRKQIVYPEMSFDKKSLKTYLQCLKFVYRTAMEEKADLIHFMDGDKIMRYFGAGLNRLSRKWPVVITYHHFFEGLARRVSYARMCHNRYPAVHMIDFQKKLASWGFQNSTHIEYPSFLSFDAPRRENAAPVIGMFGGTRVDKGLDILMKALERVKSPFHLIVAGREADYTRAQIEEMAAPIREKVTLDLRFLTEEELTAYWEKTDLVVLPYRAIFDGASGQLTEGVNRGLPIIGPSHGSLARIITENHLGRTFATEDCADLAKTIDEMLQTDFTYDETARAYQKQMSPQRFCEEYEALYAKAMTKQAK